MWPLSCRKNIVFGLNRKHRCSVEIMNVRRFVICVIVPLIAACARSTDVLVVGGGTSGVAAGIQAARSGVNAMIIEEGPWLGGMLTSAGVSAVDGNYNLRSGIFGEFCDSLAFHYGGWDSLKTGWVSNILFEPSVGNKIFKSMASAEKCLDVRYGLEFEKVENSLAAGKFISEISLMAWI